ncbi:MULTISPECIES: SH3 domain-containing protein [Falsihalocynthiibacter]|uniref:SH3 domain-containing protein n=1 Tax=Falsihalocynthiibacter TaxID=2854182 RepID=UPI0030027EB6
MKSKLCLFGLINSLVLCFSMQAAAQSKEMFLEAFSGQWLIFDTSFSTSPAPCSFELTNVIELRGVVEESQLRPSGTSENCVAPFDSVKAWDIEDNQLALYAENDALIARLGGNQNRVTGDVGYTFRSVILERANGAPENAKFSQALREHRCIYKGYTAECATKEELALPVFTEGGGVISSVELLVNLNVREQPRGNSLSVGTLPKGTCLKVNYCTTASDGIWCRARFGEAAGWIKKTMLRKDEWPIATYLNAC